MTASIRRLSLALVLGLGMGLSVSTQARGISDIQFNSIRCGDFLQDLAEADEDSIGFIFMWLDGYLSGVSGDTVLRWRGLEGFTEELIDYCANSPRSRVLEAAREVGIDY
jgi:acid stress chaperone HdeB